MEKRKIEFDVLYRLCNKEQLFTAGSNNQYKKMFELAAKGISKTELACILYVCSVYELDVICTMIAPLFENTEEN